MLRSDRSDRDHASGALSMIPSSCALVLLFPANVVPPDSLTRIILKRARRDAIQYKHSKRFDDKYWEDAQKSADDIAELCEATLRVVRDRVQEWEIFPPEAGTPGRT